MGIGETISLIAVVGLVIGVLIFVGGIVKRTFAYKERQLELTAGQTAEKAAQYAAHNRELEERVQVLERIITDRGYDVATQIDALRDARRVEEQIDNADDFSGVSAGAGRQS